MLASLNHPHIAQIHGFEDANGEHALVMELVEGPTLADRISQALEALAAIEAKRAAASNSDSSLGSASPRQPKRSRSRDRHYR